MVQGTVHAATTCRLRIINDSNADEDFGVYQVDVGPEPGPLLEGDRLGGGLHGQGRRL